MLTEEENELLTRVGPGTPAGELYRRYWHPVAMVPEISESSPTKFVRILGEDLVLFRDKSGRVGLVGDHCPHRGASLLYGRVEERGIACAYHGWLYDVNGNCLETPAEPTDSLLYLTVRHKAYPVREHYGLYWAYLGPAPAPELPRYDIMEMGRIDAIDLMPLDCNWLQDAENHVDQSHVVILHQQTGRGNFAPHATDRAPNTTRGRVDELVSIEYSETPFGIKRRQIHRDGFDDADLIPFPGSQRIFNILSVKVPVDDTHTLQYRMYMDVPSGNLGDRPVEYYFAATGKSRTDAIHPVAQHSMVELIFQDVMAMETQGPISNRPHERLGTADRGVVLYREVLKREIEKVQQGLEPIGVVRDPEAEPIDTFVQSYIDMVSRGLARPFNCQSNSCRAVPAAGGAIDVASPS
jgi:5,5'-dehydrodivanillate O-demethylase